MHALRLPQSILRTLRAHARAEFPRECVGFLFGEHFEVHRSLALRNIATAPETRFFADPLDILRALREADSQGDTLLGVYHSHPSGPEGLSQDDLAHAQPGLVQLLLAPSKVRAFIVSDSVSREIGLEVVRKPPGLL